jgi:NAD(P)-dependent dehydrogenase (short-subunit alcohol dehydrogenase family)
MSENNPMAARVVIITGAGRGLGRAIAYAFGDAGATLALNDLTPINLDQTVDHIRLKGGNVHVFLEDISKGLPAQALIMQVLEELGRIDILINNAGVRPKSLLEHMDEWDWQRTLDVNLSGPFLLMQAVVQPMRRQGGGTIINIAATPPAEGVPSEQGAFYASKTALIALSQTAAKEFWNYNIQVHVICPLDLSDPASYEPIIQQILNLCRPEAAHQTGQVIRVNERGEMLKGAV